MKYWMVASLLLLGIAANGQKRPGFEKIREARIEFMKKKLSLTPDEEKNFIPLYSKLMDEMDSLRREFKQETDLNDLDLTFMTDKECEKVVDDILVFKEKELEMIKRYNAEFKKVLPIKKVAMIYKAEHEFKREIVRRIREEKRDK